MSSFLSGLMSIAAAVEAEPPKPVAPPTDSRQRGAETRSAKARQRYAAVFAEPRTISSAASALEISHVGCLNQVYRYEQRGLIRRLAEQVNAGYGARAIQWEWIK